MNLHFSNTCWKQAKIVKSFSAPLKIISHIVGWDSLLTNTLENIHSFFSSSPRKQDINTGAYISQPLGRYAKPCDNYFFNIYLFVIDWWLVYNIGLISVINQHEWTKGVHMSPTSWVSLPPPTHSQPLDYYRAPVWVPWVVQQIPIGSLFAYTSVYASMLLCPFISPSPSFPPPLSISLFSVSVSPLLLCEQICQYILLDPIYMY